MATVVDKNKKFEESGRILLLITIVVYFVLMFVMFRQEMRVGLKSVNKIGVSKTAKKQVLLKNYTLDLYLIST